MNISRFAILICMLLVRPVLADAPVWKVSKDDSFLFIGGTIHVLQAQDYPLPAEFERAYDAADELVFEVDIANLNPLAFQQQLMQAAVYQDGSTLASHLTPETYQKLQSYADQHGIPLQGFAPMKVGMLVLLLTAFELERLGIKEAGVDQFYSDKAIADQKPTAALETIEQQIKFIANLGEGEEDGLVLQTIEELNTLADEFAALKLAWQHGDMQAMINISLKDIQSFPKVYQSLLVDRNRAWTPKIEAMLDDADVEYVLVGVLHLAGEDSVLAMLKARGYQVEQL